MVSQIPLLRVLDLSVELDNELILEKISFDLFEGENLVILGPNGAGKTVLLKSLLSLLPFEGTIEWREDLKISYVPQRVQTNRDIPMTVRDFFSLKAIEDDILISLLKSVGISSIAFLEKQLGTLSTGQFQRVLIAFAMSKNPDVVLFDEPMAGVDVGGEDIIHTYLHNEAVRNKKMSSILVTHDLSMVYKEASKVLCINRNRAFLGSPMEVLDPARLEEIYGHEVSYVGHHHG